MLANALGLAVALQGCPDEEPDAPSRDAGPDASSVCPTGYLGDPLLPPVIELRALRADGADVPLADGDDLAVLFPPQGGRVAFVGVRLGRIASRGRPDRTARRLSASSG